MLKSVNPAHIINISLLFTGLLFSIPFISMHHEQPLPTFYTEWLAAVLGLIATFPLLRSAYWRGTQLSFEKTVSINLSYLKIPQISLIFLGLSAILYLQWLLGILHSAQYGLLVLSYLVWGFFLVLLGNYLQREIGLERFAITLAWSLVGAGIINICIVVLQFVELTGGFIPFLPKLWTFGALSQTNHFADFCALAIASLIYLYAKGRFSKSFFCLILVLFLFMLSFSGSRSAWLYLIAMTILMTALHFNAKQSRQKNSAFHLYLVSFLLIPLFIIIQLFIYFVIPNEFVNLPTERLIDGVTTHTASARIQFWYDSFRIFIQYPWLGVGAGKFMLNTFLLLDSPTAMASKRVFEHAHNLFMHLLAEMGIAGFLIVFIGLIIWVRAFKWRDLNLETWWLISLLSVLGIHSMLEYPLWHTFFLGIAAILLGAGDRNNISIKLSKNTIRCMRSSLIILWLLGAFNITTLLISNVKLENWVQKFAYQNVNDLDRLDWVKHYSLLSPYSELMFVGSMDINRQIIDEQFLLNHSAMIFKPMKTITYQRALLLELKGYHADAVNQLNRALIAFPDTFQTFTKNVPIIYRQKYLDLYAETEVGHATSPK